MRTKRETFVELASLGHEPNVEKSGGDDTPLASWFVTVFLSGLQINARTDGAT